MFKLKPALKDPAMKYPRAANLTLDFAMLLSITGALCLAGMMINALPEWLF